MLRLLPKRVLLPQCGLYRPLTTGSASYTEPLQWIDGKRAQPTDSKEDFQFVQPSTGECIRSVPSSGQGDVDAAVQSAKQAFSVWRETPPRERGAVLKKAAEIARANLDDIAWIETLDNGKPLWESKLDIEGCADSLDYNGSLVNFLNGQYVPLPNNSHGYTSREPLGVVGCIGAFNFPFQMASWKSATALACGNTVVFKPSPLTPLTTVSMAEIYKQAGLPDGCYNVIQGGVSTGSSLSTHPLVSKMSFTGSVPTGTKIMEACAQDIKKVTLELGGKSPLIIFDDCDLENAVKGTLMANFLTQGQVCSNGTRVYVHKDIKDKFLKLLVEKTLAIKVGDPFKDDTMSGAMISEAQGQKVMGYIESAKQEGATILCGGERVTPSPELSGGFYITPCVVSDVTDNMRVAREEIFGPVVSVLEFESEDDVIKRANDSIFGLAGGVFTKDIQRAHRVVRNIEAGNLYINNYNMYPADLPFGGYKQSGIGREQGLVCLDYFTQIKTVYVEGGDVWSPFE